MFIPLDSFGYPDPTYLVRVTEELREKGITVDWQQGNVALWDILGTSAFSCCWSRLSCRFQPVWWPTRPRGPAEEFSQLPQGCPAVESGSPWLIVPVFIGISLSSAKPSALCERKRLIRVQGILVLNNPERLLAIVQFKNALFQTGSLCT